MPDRRPVGSVVADPHGGVVEGRRFNSQPTPQLQVGVVHAGAVDCGGGQVPFRAVVGIIAVLMGVLIPALNVVQKMVRNTKQKAQLTTIDLAITAFKSDYGDYPPSDWQNLSNGNRDYSGAQMLTEALLGWDLMGFHPESAWRADGKDASDGDLYEIAINGTPDEQEKNLKERIESYIERTHIGAFYVGKTK